MANFSCDGVSIEIPNDVLPTVKGWIKDRDAQIKELTSEVGALKTQCDAMQKTYDMFPMKIGDKSYDSPMELRDAMKKTCDMFPVKMGNKSCDSPMELMEFLETLINEKEMMAEDNSKLQGRCDALEEQLKSAPKINMDAVNARIKLQKQAYPFMVRANSQFNDDSFIGMSDRQIQEAVVKVAFPELDVANRDDAAISAMFEVACQTPPQLDSTVPLRNALGGIVPSLPKTAQDASDERAKEIQSAYKWIEAN